MSECVFCQIAAGEAPATIVREWDDAIAIVPLNPVTPGHLLVLPKRHVETFFSDPDTSAATMRRVSEMVHGVELHHDPNDYNVITSAGRWATQTVMHLHVHLVPRRPNDGLALPWSPNTHETACDGLRCPCYVQGQLDLAEAIKVMQRLGLPIDDVLAAGAKG